MDLSKKDRLLLLNQYRILSLLDENEDYAEAVDILTRGVKADYEDLAAELFDEVSEADSTFVADILDIYRGIDAFLIGNADPDVTGHSLFPFPGFDGNHETALMGLVRHHHKHGKWTELVKHSDETDGFNSHTRMRDRYERMIVKRKGFGPSIDFTKEQILEILNA